MSCLLTRQWFTINLQSLSTLSNVCLSYLLTYIAWITLLTCNSIKAAPGFALGRVIRRGDVANQNIISQFEERLAEPCACRGFVAHI